MTARAGRVALAAAGIALAACAVYAWGPLPGGESARELGRMRKALEPLHAKMRRPGPSDWLANHDEPGQTFRQYLRCDPTLPTDDRHTIYIQPLGEFTEGQRKVVDLTAEFMGLYFGLPVEAMDDLPLSVVPGRYRRRIRGDGRPLQIRSDYVLDEVLPPRRPDDAAAYIAFTAVDLWPGEGWTFVVGQASLAQRVGVWSIARNGDADGPDWALALCLLRTLKTGTHETGHMFSLLHCTAWRCNMNGSNHRGESDSKPLALCPECVAKVCWATGAGPVDRYRKLAEFCERNALEPEAEFYRRSLAALKHDR